MIFDLRDNEAIKAVEPAVARFCGVVFARAAAHGYLSRCRGTVIPSRPATLRTRFPYLRGQQNPAPFPGAVTEPVLNQGSPYGLAVVARDTERK